MEKEVKERSKKDSEKEQQEAEAPIIQPGLGGRLMLTQGNGWVIPFHYLVPGFLTPFQLPRTGATSHDA